MQFIDLMAQQELIRSKIDARITSVLNEGKFIMGPEVKELEAQLATFCGAKYCFGVANGTDALEIALLAFGAKEKDAIFCPAFTFASTAEVIPRTGATPFFVDVDANSFNIDPESLKKAIAEAKALGLNPAGIIPVDLFGQSADYDALEEIARGEDLWILSDSAQGFGSNYKGRITGSIGDIATTSFFPAKPLGCYGDGGAIFTDNEHYAGLIGSLRIHGKGTHKYDNERIGVNSRLDTMQAAILLEKLAIYPEEIIKRQNVADAYNELLAGSKFQTPLVDPNIQSVWAQYTLKAQSNVARDGALAALKDAGIPGMIYYPIPLHQQTAYKNFPKVSSGLPICETLSQSVFSIPMHPYMKRADQEKVADVLNSL